MLNMNLYQGRLTRDVETKEVGGNTVANFTIAVERSFKNAQGERETDYISCQAWRRTADNIAKYFHKGDGIIVVGRTQVRSYMKDGQKIYITETVVDQFDFPLQNKRDDKPDSKPKTKSKPVDDDPFEANDDSYQIDDSALPF